MNLDLLYIVFSAIRMMWWWGLGQRRCGVMSVCVVSLCVDGRFRYLYIMLGGYLCIFSAPSVQFCCTLSISASYHLFIYLSVADIANPD